MNITSTQMNFKPQLRGLAPGPSKINENITFTNEPTIPMDAVMRGFQQIDLPEDTGIIAGFSALGALGGAVAGATGQGAWMIPANIASSVVLDTAALTLPLVGQPMAGVGFMMGSTLGATAGVIGGTLGYAASALTGVNPIVTGAVAGGLTHFAVAAFS